MNTPICGYGAVLFYTSSMTSIVFPWLLYNFFFVVGMFWNSSYAHSTHSILYIQYLYVLQRRGAVWTDKEWDAFVFRNCMNDLCLWKAIFHRISGIVFAIIWGFIRNLYKTKPSACKSENRLEFTPITLNSYQLVSKTKRNQGKSLIFVLYYEIALFT